MMATYEKLTMLGDFNQMCFILRVALPPLLSIRFGSARSGYGELDAGVHRG